MKCLGTVSLLVLNVAKLVRGHGYVEEVTIGGVKYPGYNPYLDNHIAKPTPPARLFYPIVENHPVYDPTEGNITCNWTREEEGLPKLTAVARAGSNMTIRWTRWPESHFGPQMTYLAWCGGKKCSEYDVRNPEARFFKISQDGWNSRTRTWLQEDFLKNNSTLTVTLPKNIPNGEYVVRHELLALHAVTNDKYGPEFYPQCWQITITGGTGTTIPAGVPFPGAYQPNDPGIEFRTNRSNIVSYPFPGPPILVN
ncbi:family 61 glycosyl hydrolase [Ascobolus immersus RN42]|uniref:lytic cellulose monooxygenase (C4-dehydrogenating) n=1 Tax=Ascobolus immersus RN42 TaxID=1160509 RepID=A0A3N4IRH4_ASCIM|nr:family 61 glycosyl hydrolase [Ascobolus immersus RN42]